MTGDSNTVGLNMIMIVLIQTVSGMLTEQDMGSPEPGGVLGGLFGLLVIAAILWFIFSGED